MCLGICYNANRHKDDNKLMISTPFLYLSRGGSKLIISYKKSLKQSHGTFPFNSPCYILKINK